MKTEVVEVDKVLASRFSLLPLSPSLFQKRINGPDVRIHVVGSNIFAIKITFKGVDYRFPGRFEKGLYGNINIPINIQINCFDYCNTNMLSFAGFDFKICNDTGIWYVLEANPMPGYDMYDRRLGGAISSSLLSLLSSDFSSMNDDKQKPSTPFVSKSRRYIINPLNSHASTK